MENKKNETTTHFYQRTGGEQPLSLEPKEINRYFQGNYAKVWAMHHGYIANFRSLEGTTIKFDLITDPRLPKNQYAFMKLCIFIAGLYREKITLLKEITHFEVDHYFADDIIGYHLSGNELDQLPEYNSRI